MGRGGGFLGSKKEYKKTGKQEKNLPRQFLVS